MAKRGMVIFLLAAQIIGSLGAVVHHADAHPNSNLRIQSNSSMMFSFSHSTWNNIVSNLMQKQVEVQQPYPQPGSAPPKRNKLALLLISYIFGLCGIDRCIIGQCCLGVAKGLTLGGIGIWYVLDYWVLIINSLTKAKEIHEFGWHLVWAEDSIDDAYYLAIVLVVWFFLHLFRTSMTTSQQATLQTQQQARLQTDIPRRHQSLPYMPTALSRGLRKAGILQEKPTIPELIAAFDAIDKNGDGQLDRDEIKAAIGAMGASNETVDEMIKAADTDGDGKISKNEFLASMTGR